MQLREFLDGLKGLGFFDSDDGAGCEALRLDLSQGYYLLVTNDDFSIPHEPPVIVGLYNSDDRQLAAGQYKTLARAYAGVIRLRQYGANVAQQRKAAG